METKGYVQRQMQEADANYHVKMREAEAIKAQAEAYKHLADAFGGAQGLLQYMMLKEGIHEKLALANAKAIQGLSPKITVWNTGDQVWQQWCGRQSGSDQEHYARAATTPDDDKRTDWYLTAVVDDADAEAAGAHQWEDDG